MQRTEQLSRASEESGPQLAEGAELLGRFEDSGYRDPPFMVRRADGQMVQLPELLYLIVERCDGTRSYEDLASEVTEAFGRGLEAEDVRMLVDEKLRPLGVLALADGSQPRLEKVNPLLALRFRAALIPERVTNGLAVAFRPVFFLPVVLAVVVGLAAFDVWLFFVHGVAQSLRQLLYQPLYMVLTFAIIVVAAAFHETGHASACRFGGARPGVMGAGIYIVWPAFYTDVTDAYRLGKGGRLRTDLGGVYFNAIFILATGGVYFLTGFEPLLILIFIQHLEIVRQLLPILRLDGYYVLSDLTGVPDLFSRLGPILVSLVPGRKPDKRVVELKPWVRLAVTGWVLLVVPVLAFNVLMMLVYAPRVFATGWDSFFVHLDQTTAAFGEGRALAGGAGIIRLLTLALPAAGIAYSFSRIGTRLTRKLWTGTDGRPALRGAGVLALAGLVGLLAYLWWPDGDYTPVRPGERWTVPEAVAVAASTFSGEGEPFGSAAGGTAGEQTTGTAGDEATEPSPSPTSSPITSPSPSPTSSPTTSPSPSPTPTGET